MDKQSLIIVGDFNRTDFLYVAKILKEDYRIYFLEYTVKSEIERDEYQQYGGAIFWSSFNSAQDLITKIKPVKVLFYFIETYNHVALNLACKLAGIKTYHIEHGIRSHEFLKIDFSIPELSIGDKIKNYVEILGTFRARLKGRQFFKNTVKNLPSVYANFLTHYYNIRKKESIAQTFEIIKSEYRLAKVYISFSPKIFNFHVINDHLPPAYPVKFIGCPAFDYLAELNIENATNESIIFIDNAFEAQQLFGWNENNKKQFLQSLINFSESTGKKLLIKMHPYSNLALYEEVINNRNVAIISNEQFVPAVANSSIIIGFYSTLMMPLMAMRHTVCFSLEMHPAPVAKPLSDFLTNTGASLQIKNWDELYQAYTNIDFLYQQQSIVKEAFIKDWLYKFDGKSSERFIEALYS
jgi:hypothetical protein